MQRLVTDQTVAQLSMCSKAARHSLLSYFHTLRVSDKTKASLNYQELTVLFFLSSVIVWSGNNVGRPLREVSPPTSHKSGHL